MAGFLRSCLQSLLKLVNSVMGMAGIVMIVYSLWMLRVWFRDLDDLGSDARPPCNWEDDLPEDQSGRLDDLKDFVKSNFDLCKWVGLLVLAAQVFSIFLAIVLRALGPDQARYYDSDEDYTPARLPLLANHAQPSPYVLEPHNLPKTDAWDARV